MIKHELIDRSPARFFEQAINGGLKPGEIGVLTSIKGLGKTSVLVQLGLDRLLQGKQVVHVSFNQQSDFVMSWYEDIFAEISKRKNAKEVNDIKNEIMKKRVVLNFNQDNIGASQIVKTLKALATGGISTDYLYIDGLDFSKVTNENIATFKEYAKEAKLTIWFSCNTDGKLPAILDKLDAIVTLEQKPDVIEMNVAKVRGEAITDRNLKLDSKTLLISLK
ncbi:MAG: hypothetical protein GX220_08305 [Treponema sp.]|nr:hypothetical protein [Treponema sp.]